MLARLSRAGLLWPTLLSVVGLGVLVSLGNWQMSRKAEKELLIAKVDERRLGAPVALEMVVQNSASDRVDYQRVSLKGRFLPGLSRFYYAPDQRMGPGYDVYEPLEYAPDQIVWVNRGYIPKALRGEPERWSGSGEVSLTGHARMPGAQGRFSPPNDVANNVWYWRDLEGMQASAFEGRSGAAPAAAPFFVVAEAAAKSRPDSTEWPRPGVSEFRISNKHLEYALTWYGLAVTLMAVFGAFAWARLSKIS
ncbi:MAG: SURF1 family cytochrome oxidase biogenesis protein [Filomicrobium sp.]